MATAAAAGSFGPSSYARLTRGVNKPGDDKILPPPSSPAVSAKSSSGAGTVVGELPDVAAATSGAGSSYYRPDTPEKGRGGGGGEGGGGGGGAGALLLPRMTSSQTFGESGLLPSWTSVSSFAGGTGGGLKRARDRRADRRKKKDPFEALEERLLDGFSLESITRQLELQDETLQKGVRPETYIHGRARAFTSFTF